MSERLSPARKNRADAGASDLKPAVGKYDPMADFEGEVRRIRGGSGRGPESNSFSRSEVLDFLRATAKGFENMEPLLKIPERLFRIRSARDEEYCAVDGAGMLHVASALRRAGAKLPPASELSFSVGLTDSSSQTYFFLCDPERKIIVLERLLYLGEGSWDGAARAVEAALRRKSEADAKGEHYNLVACVSGSLSLRV
ncbi:MAG TPA: hypothetical protein VLD37_06580 [Candidatus Bilamarchaeum sp.]|nr:hypothetical protein [Candidatus Bilamarchaeum sp.]